MMDFEQVPGGIPARVGVRTAVSLAATLCLWSLSAHAQPVVPELSEEKVAAVDPKDETQAAHHDLNQVVITARRVQTKLSDVPQRVEVVTTKDVDKTIQNDLTDLLKKNASVDVVQYPGALSGIGIRGFSPEYNGINRHTALLVDGRPVSADNLATVNMNSIERVEVMKGPGSALYGSGAMGGVVNMISRQSKGDVHGRLGLSAGQFDTGELKFRAGGSLTDAVDFDYAGSRIQANDFKMGNGEVRPFTGYKMEAHSLRAGLDFSPDWRLVGKWNEWTGEDIESPGDLAYGTNAQQRKQMHNSDRDLRLTGAFENHALTAAVFSGVQTSESTTVTSMTAAYRPQLPAVNFRGNLEFFGWQAQDAWEWARDAVLLMGVDSQEVQSVSQSYNLAVAGTPRKDPGTADNQRTSTGAFLESSWKFNHGDTVGYVGVRRDNTTVETMDTPYKTGFTPSSVDFISTNPSAGLKHKINDALSVHATVGRAFVAPNALYVTGNYQTPRNVSGNIVYDYTFGNPDIRPETSLSKDIGLEWVSLNFGGDVTVFDTKVTNRIVAVKTTDTSGGPNNGGVTTTYQNGDFARIRGVEAQIHWIFATHAKLSVGSTKYFHDWTLVDGAHVDTNIVPRIALKVALDADMGVWNGRIGMRYRGPMKDQDWVSGGGKQIGIGGFAVFDVSARYRIKKGQSVGISIDNVGDRFYTEKFGYNMSGRNIRANYQYDF
jgi:vitamin B12 transporter